MKQNSILFAVVILCVLLSSCSKSISKSPLQLEAEKYAQEWFDSSFAKCGDTLLTKYDGTKITLENTVMFMDKGYLQFKDLILVVKEEPLIEADKLNGIEWKGIVTFMPLKPTLRYYWSSSSDKKWSEWKESFVLYAPNLLTPGLSRKGSPLLRNLKKEKGKWSSLGMGNYGDNDFIKPQCEEIPQ